MPDNPQQAAYSNHEQLVEQARRYPEIWRLFVGLALIVVVVSALNAVLFVAVASLAPPDWTESLLQGSTPLALLIILGSFVFAIFGVALAVRWMQHRALITVIGPLPLALRQFWRVSAVLAILGLALIALPPYDMGAPLSLNLPLSTWLMLLPLSVGAVLIQTSAEEILFRGYMQQSLAARFRSRVIWIGLPSVLFAAGHYAPATAGENAMLIAVWAGVFAVLTADLTARSGTLGPAIALHFFNNASALLLFSLPDNLGGLALYHLPYDTSDTALLRQWLYVDFALMIAAWLSARIALRR